MQLQTGNWKKVRQLAMAEYGSSALAFLNGQTETPSEEGVTFELGIWEQFAESAISRLNKGLPIDVDSVLSDPPCGGVVTSLDNAIRKRKAENVERLCALYGENPEPPPKCNGKPLRRWESDNADCLFSLDIEGGHDWDSEGAQKLGRLIAGTPPEEVEVKVAPPEEVVEVESADDEEEYPPQEGLSELERLIAEQTADDSHDWGGIELSADLDSDYDDSDYDSWENWN